MSRATACLPAVEPHFEPLEPRLLLSGIPVGSPASDAVSPEAASLVDQNNAFAFDLYDALREEDGSLFFSPLSVSAALAMTYLGAAGRTADQMADTLHWDAPAAELADAFHDLIAVLDRDEAAADPDADDTLTLDIANAMWGQMGFPFLQTFADVLESAYGAPLGRLDFVGDPGGAAGEINDWVNEATRGLIPKAVSPDDFNELTRFVLANAIYFNGSWEHAFDENATRTGAFHLPGGDVDARLMHQTRRFRYGETDDYQVLELPYTGGASMVVLLPREGRFEAVEQSLSAEAMDTILADMHYRDVSVTLPKIDCSTTYDLVPVLEAMGMPDAFDGRLADFSGMNGVHEGPDRLLIDGVKHLARIKVDESRTEAAAVTVIIGAVSNDAYHPPPVVFQADRPFIYTIRDTGTGSTLFLGRVSDASALLKPEDDASAEDDQDPTDPPQLFFPDMPPGVEPVPIGPPGWVLPGPGPVDLVRPEAPADTAPADEMASPADLLASPEVATLLADARADAAADATAFIGQAPVAPPEAPAFPTLGDPVRAIDLDALPDPAALTGTLPANAPAPLATPALAEASPAPDANPLEGSPLDVLAGEALRVLLGE